MELDQYWWEIVGLCGSDPDPFKYKQIANDLF